MAKCKECKWFKEQYKGKSCFDDHGKKETDRACKEFTPTEEAQEKPKPKEFNWESIIKEDKSVIETNKLVKTIAINKNNIEKELLSYYSFITNRFKLPNDFSTKRDLKPLLNAFSQTQANIERVSAIKLELVRKKRHLDEVYQNMVMYLQDKYKEPLNKLKNDTMRRTHINFVLSSLHYKIQIIDNLIYQCGEVDRVLNKSSFTIEAFKKLGIAMVD